MSKDQQTTRATAPQSDDYDPAQYDEQPPIDGDVEVRPGTAMVPMGRAYPMATGNAPGSTDGLSMLKMTIGESNIIRAPLDKETEIELRPDCIPFMPGGAMHERLIRAFGPGQVALRLERDPFYDSQTNECCVDGSLWIRGFYVARSIGGCKWSPKNFQMTKSDAIEGAKTDCIKRCCKELGMGAELRNPTFIREFIDEYAVPYGGTAYDWKTKKQQPKTLWRKKGVALTGQALESATGIAGEFPLGFSSDTKVPDGPLSGHKLSELTEAQLTTVVEKASLKEFRLAAKAEIVHRLEQAREKAEAEADQSTETTGDVQLSDVLGNVDSPTGKVGDPG